MSKELRGGQNFYEDMVQISQKAFEPVSHEGLSAGTVEEFIQAIKQIAAKAFDPLGTQGGEK